MATDVRADHVDVSEFRENLDHFLESTGAVRVTRDGEIIGVYTPLRSRRGSLLKKQTSGHWSWPSFRKSCWDKWKRRT
jgi:hypothetical protein